MTTHRTPDQDSPAPPAAAPERAPDSRSTPASDRYLGCTIDNRYKVESIIGEGGMGVVYRCRHKIIDKRVALKILRADLAREREVTERFLMEAKAASAIADEHIINISDFGQLPDGAAYFVMELLDGTPLSVLTAAGSPLPLGRLLFVAIQLTEGLGAAHQRGIVHRDLKPDNVFLVTKGKQKDFVKILDFGIAKVNKPNKGRLTQAGAVFGTPHYMSPEQAAGAPLDHRSDIYSLGIMLYELATGQVPFDAENFVGILSQQLYEEPVPPRDTPGGAGLSPRLEALILKCLAKAASDRFQSMAELRQELTSLQAELGPPPSSPLGGEVAIGPAPLSAATAPRGEAVATRGALAHPPEPASDQGSVLSAGRTRPSQRPRRWPMYAAIATPLAVVLVVFGAQIGANRARASREPPPLPRPQLTPVEPTPEPERTVLVGVTPSEAHVFREGDDLGPSPVSIPVPSGRMIFVEVRHAGYQTRGLELDGKQRRVNVKLEPEKPSSTKARRRKRPAKPRRRPSAERSSPKSSQPKEEPEPRRSVSGGLLVEPWGGK